MEERPSEMVADETGRVELAERSGSGIEARLVWSRRAAVDQLFVCVRDRLEDAYFEIPVEPHVALEVYYHPFVYRDFSTVDYQGARLMAEDVDAG
jgi:hypothetical protein